MNPSNKENKMSQRFIDLAVQLEALEVSIQAVREELVKEMEVLKIGAFVQDPTTQLVYKIIEPKGKFTYFSKIDYVRTAKSDERCGTLSQKEAKEAGFTLAGK